MKLSKIKKYLIWKKTNGHCFYCGSPIVKHIDHVISRKMWKEWELEKTPDGNPNKTANLFLSCIRCNLKKGCQCPEDFIGRSFVAWSRYIRANHRVGLEKQMTTENL